MKKKFAAALGAFLVAAFVLTGCSYNQEYNARKDLQKSTTKSQSLELTNLKEKLKREEDPNAIRYVYALSFGNFVGYWVAKGKISSNGSQVAPEQEIICRYSGDSCQAVDSAHDDGSYGANEPGVFFFTAEGNMIVTTVDTIYSDVPFNIDVPRLVE